MRFEFYEKDRVIGLDDPYKDALGDLIRGEKGKLQYFRLGGRALEDQISNSQKLRFHGLCNFSYLNLKGLITIIETVQSRLQTHR